MPHHWRPLAHERNSIFKCKQTVHGPWGPEKYDYTMMKYGATFYKTALFYAREQLLSEMWTADHLFDCILYCLNLIRDWTISGHFPHYIMDDVNLFDGKLNSEQRARLRTVLDIIMDTHLAPLAFVKIGVRLQNNVYTVAIRDTNPRWSGDCTVPQLSIKIFYNSTPSILLQRIGIILLDEKMT